MNSHARKTDPITSHLAAAENRKRRPAQVNEVAVFVAKYPGLTSSELAAKAKLDRYMVARRLPDAERAGLVRRGMQRKCRIGGRPAMVWYPAGKEAK